VAGIVVADEADLPAILDRLTPLARDLDKILSMQ